VSAKAKCWSRKRYCRCAKADSKLNVQSMKTTRRADSAPAKVAEKATSEKLRITGRAWRKEVCASLALCAIALIAYSNSFHAGFTLDNGVLLQEKQIHVATLRNIGLIFGHTYWWPTIETGLYRPLTILSFLFNYAVLGNAERPEGYHWINFVLHAGNILLAFAVALRLVRSRHSNVYRATNPAHRGRLYAGAHEHLLPGDHLRIL
jgi:hypothetical protein